MIGYIVRTSNPLEHGFRNPFISPFHQYLKLYLPSPRNKKTLHVLQTRGVIPKAAKKNAFAFPSIALHEPLRTLLSPRAYSSLGGIMSDSAQQSRQSRGERTARTCNRYERTRSRENEKIRFRARASITPAREKGAWPFTR